MTKREFTLRPASHIMRLSQLGSYHQCRLSFMRQLTRRMANEGWEFKRTKFDFDEKGVGVAVYSAKVKEHIYSLVAFGHDLSPEQRSDRVIAEAWDSTFTLFDGEPSEDDIIRLAQNVPLQEAGRISDKELTLARANRSVRLWSSVINALAEGKQPDKEEIEKTGYLMRTTAVYGSGKFGAADREKISSRPEMTPPFQAEMLTVYLIRTYVRDLVNHIAKAKGGEKAVPLNRLNSELLGIGNSTGLGMAPFIINHPILFNNWILAREKAILRVREIKKPSDSEISAFHKFLNAFKVTLSQWQSEHPTQIKKLASLNNDIRQLDDYLSTNKLDKEYPFDELLNFAQNNLSPEGEECLASLMLEPFGYLIDDLAASMSDDTDFFTILGEMKTDEISKTIEQKHAWILSLDWSSKNETARAWYISEEKLEPRLGERYEEPIADYEQPLAPAWDMAKLYQDLTHSPKQTVGEFLQSNPVHRHVIRRLQKCMEHPYAEIYNNTISSTLMPIDMLRVKLAFFGATRFDPRSDRWVRISMFGGAPYPEDLTNKNSDFWVYPSLESEGV